MVIGVCDDDRIWCGRAEGLIEEYAEKVNLEAELFRFENGGELLSYEGEPLDLLFLDIELHGENGVELAGAVNAKWPGCMIVYLTNYLSYATEVYDTAHVFYVLKEQFGARLGRIFGKVFQEQEKHQKQLRFLCKGSRMICLAPEDIYYFERRERKTFIETVWGSYETSERIEKILQQLPQTDFIRCHNSYIIYLPNVQEARKDEFCMKNGAVITISRGYAKETKAAFSRWIMAQMI